MYAEVNYKYVVTLYFYIPNIFLIRIVHKMLSSNYTGRWKWVDRICGRVIRRAVWDRYLQITRKIDRFSAFLTGLHPAFFVTETNVEIHTI